MTGAPGKSAGERVIGCTTSTFGGPLATKLAAISRAGFAATEFWPRDLFESAEGPTVAVDLLRANGLAVSVYQALRDYEGAPEPERARRLDVAAQMMDQMALIGADLLALPSSSAPDASGDPGRIAADLHRIGELAASRGMRVAFEPIAWGRHIRTFEQAWRAVRASDHPSVGLMLDSFHAFVQDTPLSPIGAIPGEKIFLVELADFARSALPAIELSRDYRLFPGEGFSPVAAFLQAVDATGYRGPISIEIFSAACRAADPFEIAERAMRSARALLREAAA